MRNQFTLVPIMTLGFAFIPIVSAAATCYYTNGSVDSINDQLACDPTAAVSACCNPVDYCLSNGLCFDAGANNLLAVQGCTDPKWGSPCHTYCPYEIGIGNNLFPCANTEPAGGGSLEFCCGHMATNVSACCANGGAFSVPVGQIVLRSFQISSYLASSSYTATSGPSTAAGPTSSTLSSLSGSSTSSNSKTLALGLGVGLGVGIPVALLLIGALLFLGLQLKRQNNSPAPPMASGAPPMTGSYPPGVEIAGRQKMGVRNELDAQGQVYEMPYQGNY